jgi:hypothetical protein
LAAQYLRRLEPEWLPARLHLKMPIYPPPGSPGGDLNVRPK